MALVELRRRPGRFGTAAIILSLISTLLMLLGGLLDGLVSGATGAVLKLPADALVYSSTADDSIVRSRLGAEIASSVAEVDGVKAVHPLAVSVFGVRLPEKDDRDLTSVALFGCESAPAGVSIPRRDGEVVADRSLEAAGFRQGMTVAVGPMRTPLTIVGWAPDLPYAGQGSLWGSMDTWRQVVSANRPDAATDAGSSQVLAVTAAEPDKAAALADAIDKATGEATSTLTLEQAAEAIPGVTQQRTTFSQIIAVTVVIAAIVVALFFALLTVERIPLYGVLKAIGATSGRLFGGLVLQALAVTAIAALVGLSLAGLFAWWVPPGVIPFQLNPARAAASIAFMLTAAIVGCSFSLRRVLAIDPAAAIGGGS